MARSAKLGFIGLLTACLVLTAAGVAFAYPNELPGYSGDLSRTMCVDCHGASADELLNPGSDPELLAGVRKGPHGGYTTGTNKCQTCHSLHNAPADGSSLLPGETIKNTCESCHDGTAGTAVYGVIKARTGLEPASAHRIEVASMIPGGDAEGGSLSGSFMGPGGTLTCSDCHSSHGTHTVDPFTGDRLRSSVSSDTTYDIKTDRLLKQEPTGSESTVTVYGAGWCTTCHMGRANQHAPESGVLADHPVMQDDAYSYDRLPVVTGVGSVETTIGGLGQSNRGYVMPGPTLGEPTQKTVLQEGSAPLCQQCHEDVRNTGPSVRETNPTLTSAGQEFLVTQPDGSSDTDNPRFQVFPHESDAENFLVREPEPAEPYSLCLNCHSLVHNATPGIADVMIFEPNQHDSSWVDMPYVAHNVDCTICHTTKLVPAHAEQCQICHSAPYNSLGSWDGTCQQGGCHVTFHAGSPEAHDPWSSSSGGGCSTCHGAGFSVTDSKCVNCHSLYSASDVTPPVTTSDAQPTYTGAGLITFSITESGKVGVGTTFYKVDGGPTQVGGSAFVSTAGSHTLTFWSIDQSGNVETPAKTTNYTIAADTEPPATTSNAAATYNGSALIRLTATDNSSVGVKATYYEMDGVSTQTGTSINASWDSGSPTVPAPQSHTLVFWSEDWSGNVESQHTVNFTITEPSATLRLIWGDCDQPYPSTFPIDNSWADWTVRIGSSTGTVFTTGSDGGNYPTWSGINNITVPVSATPYYILVNWWDDDLGVGGTNEFLQTVDTIGRVYPFYY